MFRRFLLATFIFISLSAAGYSQMVINGYVFDKKTKLSMAGVSVYFNDTSIGVVTDEKGYFEINCPTKISSSLIVSYVGYGKLELVHPFDARDSMFKIYLEETVVAIDEVVLYADPYTKEQKMKVFREQFLGRNHRNNCYILNEDVITVTYDKGSNTLLAFADEPLEIENEFLGYHIQYSLENFKAVFSGNSLNWSKLDTVFFAGVSFYKDVSDGGQKYKDRRLETYKGSSVHFLRSIADGRLKKENFMLYHNNKRVKAKKDFVVTDTLNFKHLKTLEQTYEIYYQDTKSQMVLEDKNVYIDRYGFFIPLKAIFFRGYMATLRLRDKLPLDYYPDK